MPITAVVCVAPCRIRSQPSHISAPQNTSAVSGVSASAARLRCGGNISTNMCSPKCAPRRIATAAPRNTSHMKQARATSSYQTKVLCST